MPPPDPTLNNLSLDELTTMADVAATLCRVGNDLDANGLSATFDLTPGQPVTIRLGAVMPALAGAKIDWLMYEPEVLAENALPAAPPAAPPTARDDTLQSTIAAILDEVPAFQADPPAASSHPGDGQFPFAAPSRSDDEAENTPPKVSAPSSEGVAESGGGQVMAAAPPVASAGHERTFSGTAIWTPEEDARLIGLVVSGVARLGLTKGAAMKAAAHELGRPEAGTAFRCHHKLKDRLDVALALGTTEALLDLPEDAPEPIPSPEAAPQLAEGDASVGGHPPAEVQPTPEPEPQPVKAAPVANDLTGHLTSLDDKGGWTLERDLELMELSIAGWQPQEIALELQVQAALIKSRFDALTGLYEGATGKKVRRFDRQTVFEALTRLARGAA